MSRSPLNTNAAESELQADAESKAELTCHRDSGESKSALYPLYSALLVLMTGGTIRYQPTSASAAAGRGFTSFT